MKRIEIVCHKGANEYAPENTYAAAQLCLDWGVDYVEVDVRTSQDGVFYLMHDATVDRTTNGQGVLADLPAAELDRLDAGSWFHPRFAEQRVPRLADFLRWIKGKAKVYLDVKAADPQALLALLAEVGMTEEVFCWSSSHVWALELRALAPQVALKINVKSVEEVVRAQEIYRANLIEVGLAHMSETLRAACRNRDIKVMIYQQEKDPVAFRAVLDWEADLINLNHADAFLEVMRTYQR